MPDADSILDTNISRLGPLLGFHPSVEARFERETAEGRIKELRQAVFIGLVFFHLYGLASIVLMPDVVGLTLLLRLGIMTPVGLGVAWAVGHTSPQWRERLALGGSIAAAMVPLVIVWASTAPGAAYSAGDVTLTLLYSTMMVVLRFPHALILVGTVTAVAVPSYYLKSGNSLMVAHALALQIVCASSYLLIGNYRLQRSVRVSYLRAMRAVMQSATLEVDKTELHRLSQVDPLTGLGNRRRLSEWLAAWHAGAGRDRRLTLIMIDVDHFKRYNDFHGHAAGDACLQRLAEAMQACLRDDRDLLVRYGGEEFAALLHDAAPHVAAAAADRLCVAVASLALPHADRGDGLHVVTISAGVASTQAGDHGNMRALFDAADAALYRAKQDGRNRHATSELATAPADVAGSGLPRMAA